MAWYTDMVEGARQQSGRTFYMHKGALFNILACSEVVLDENEKIELEFIGDVPYTVETFGYYVSTLSDNFVAMVYELPKRAAPSEGEDAWAADASRSGRIFSPNRVNKKAIPIDIRYLLEPNDLSDDVRYDIVPWEVGTAYTEDAFVRHNARVYQCQPAEGNTGTEPGTENPIVVWEEIGEVIQVKHYILEDVGSGPHAGDIGQSEETVAELKFDLANHNYLIVLENIDDTNGGRAFGFGVTLAVPELL